MYLYTPYITADTFDVEEEVGDITGEFYFIFGSIIQSLLKNCIDSSFTATGILREKEVMMQVSTLYSVCMFIL